MRDQRWLQGNTAGSHESHKLELLGTWEPPVSSGVAQYGVTMESQGSIFDGNKSKESKNGKNKKQNLAGKWAHSPLCRPKRGSCYAVGQRD